MKKNVLGSMLAILSVVLLFSCGKKSASAAEAARQSEESQKTFELPFPMYIERDGAKAGGTLVYGIAADTPWKGIFNTFLYTDNYDFRIMEPMIGKFLFTGENHEIMDGGYCNVSFDRSTKSVLCRIHPDLTWSDGVPVTVDDIIFVYECVGHPDYTGVRYDSDYQNVVGMEEYHAGKAKNISGLERIDNKTLKVTFKTFSVGILWAAGLPENPEPAHYLKDIPLKDMESHDRIRKMPLSCGPFVVNSMVQGDSVEYVPNPHWFGKKPKLDKLIVKRIAPTSLAATIKSGAVDLVEFTPNLYDQFVKFDESGVVVKNEYGKPMMLVDNIDFMATVDQAYGYVAMKVGTWNREKGECEVFSGGGKFKDKSLRKAIAYAMDNDSINDIYYHGLRLTPNSMITPAHPGFYDVNSKGYRYNPEKAKQLLDEAGYKDIDGDGYRETPEGKPLKINFLSMSGSDIAEPIAQFYIQNWKDIGLHVALNDGRLLEFNAFYQKIEDDDPAVELYMGGWGVGSNPDPSSLYSKKAQFNMLRWVNEENERLLRQIASEECFDPVFRNKAYREWDAHIMDEAVCIPVNYRTRLYAVNKRVASYDNLRTNNKTAWDWCDLCITGDEPAVNTMK